MTGPGNVPLLAVFAANTVLKVVSDSDIIHEVDKWTYDRVKPSGERFLLTIYKSAAGPIAAKVLNANARATKELRTNIPEMGKKEKSCSFRADKETERIGSFIS